MQLLTRFFAFVGMVLLIASCGPEALPRRNAPIQQPQSGTPLIASSGPLLAQQVPNPRAKGDPAAPIVVVEYSDYQ